MFLAWNNREVEQTNYKSTDEIFTIIINPFKTNSKQTQTITSKPKQTEYNQTTTLCKQITEQ